MDRIGHGLSLNRSAFAEPPENVPVARSWTNQRTRGHSNESIQESQSLLHGGRWIEDLRIRDYPNEPMQYELGQCEGLGPGRQPDKPCGVLPVLRCLRPVCVYENVDVRHLHGLFPPCRAELYFILCRDQRRGAV